MLLETGKVFLRLWEYVNGQTKSKSYSEETKGMLSTIHWGIRPIPNDIHEPSLDHCFPSQSPVQLFRFNGLWSIRNGEGAECGWTLFHWREILLISVFLTTCCLSLVNSRAFVFTRARSSFSHPETAQKCQRVGRTCNIPESQHWALEEEHTQILENVS